MRELLHRSYIAIDGGGTSCRFALNVPGKVVSIRRGSANVFSAPDAAIETLKSGLVDLAARAGIAEAQLVDLPLYAG